MNGSICNSSKNRNNFWSWNFGIHRTHWLKIYLNFLITHSFKQTNDLSENHVQMHFSIIAIFSRSNMYSIHLNIKSIFFNPFSVSMCLYLPKDVTLIFWYGFMQWWWCILMHILTQLHTAPSQYGINNGSMLLLHFCHSQPQKHIIFWDSKILASLM